MFLLLAIYCLFMIRILAIAKTSEKYIQVGIKEYIDRLKHFHKVEYLEISAVKNTKNLSEKEQKQREGELILKEVSEGSHLILLDEKGKEFSSEKMAKQLDKKLAGFKNVIFVIGGPYGFSDQVYQRSNDKWALSQLTFSHQMVRLFLTEQIYRCFTILKGMPYHHR